MKVRLLGIVCLFLLCGAAVGEEEDISRLLELPADYQERVVAYERLREMRRFLGKRHLPAATQFEFARQRRLQADDVGATDANGCAWSSAGPTNLNGRVTAITIDPKDNQRIYAATFGGIFRSLDAGRRWQRVSDDWLATVFSSVAVNPADTSEIFAGGGDKDMNPSYTGDGLWRSNSYGAPGTWFKVTDAASYTPFNNSVIYRVRVDPDGAHDVYVAAKNGLWKGVRDAANNISFSRVCNDPVALAGCMNAVVDDVAIDFSKTPRRIFAAVRVGSGTFSRGIYRFEGGPWVKKDSGIDTSDTEVILLGLALSNPEVLYAKVTNKTSGMHQGFYKTTTAGDAWTITADSAKLNDAGDFSWFNNTVEVDPTNENRVIASGGWPYLTTNGGEKFDNIFQGMDPEYAVEVHGDTHTAAFDPFDPNIVYVGNDGGIDKSTDMSNPKWHWIDSSHGMVASMFWNLTSNRAYPTTIAAGAQDNGINITFGNRTWYRPVWCDGFEVGTDADNPVTLYASCNGGLTEFTNPIPGTVGGGSTIGFGAPVPKGPLATDVGTSGRAIAASAGATACAAERIVTTTNGKTWMLTNTSFPPGARIAALAIAPNSSFTTFLVAVKPPDPKVCPGMSFTPFVTWTNNGGASWNPTFGLPGFFVASVAFDPQNNSRAYVLHEGLNNKMYMATSGFVFSSITGTAPTALPSGATRMAVDPWDANVLYAATPVGMFRGVITLSPLTATWAPFDEGLPDGLDVNEVWVDPSGILTIGTFGHGAYRRDVSPGAECKARMLVVRDNVYDVGRQPNSTIGMADAEHPIPDPVKPDFYKPDDTIGGKVQWYRSRDIRIDVPSTAPKQNQVENADHVEFELCPITASPCEPGAMLDAPPKAGKSARVYVQVTNRGIEPVSKARVIALWTKSAVGTPDLPKSFWKSTFPAGDTKCGALDESTGWHLVDGINPCRTIKSINPEVPEIARFDWAPALEADGGATMLTIVESADDPLESSIRKENKLHPWELVPLSRHIAMRNIKIVPVNYEVRDPFFWPLEFPHVPVEPLGEIEVVVSKADLREGVRIALPAGMAARAGIGTARRTRIEEPELVRQLESMRLDPANAWELSGDEASLFLSPRPGERVTTGVIATPADGRTSSRFYVTQRDREQVVGGVMVLFRPEGEVR